MMQIAKSAAMLALGLLAFTTLGIAYAQFPGGGGRTAAAGINHLPREQLEAFSHAFAESFPQ